MSRSGGPSGGLGPCGCDPEKVFEFADGGGSELPPEQEREMREHLASCPGCRELYKRELDLNAFLSSLDFYGARSCRSVSQGVAMALPTRSVRVRVLWGLLAGALLVLAFAFSGFDGAEPVILTMSVVGACWDFVVGSAAVARVVFATAGSALLLVLALGALADLFILSTILFTSRYRRTREA